MHDVLRVIEIFGIVPVAVIDDVKDAIPLCKALQRGGLPLIEITFRTAAAEDAIRAVSSELPDILVGAGTVLTIQQAEKAISAGADFIVSPGLNPAIVEFCKEKGVPVTPGCCTPSDIEVALSFGLDTVKYFPAEAFGGIKTLKAISAPYSMMKFIPTGGINATNLSDYLSFSKVLACGGSWMVKSDMINRGAFEEITCLTREATEIVSSVRK